MVDRESLGALLGRLDKVWDPDGSVLLAKWPRILRALRLLLAVAEAVEGHSIVAQAAAPREGCPCPTCALINALAAFRREEPKEDKPDAAR